jgi:hypothetical protein
MGEDAIVESFFLILKQLIHSFSSKITIILQDLQEKTRRYIRSNFKLEAAN